MLECGGFLGKSSWRKTITLLQKSNKSKNALVSKFRSRESHLRPLAKLQLLLLTLIWEMTLTDTFSKYFTSFHKNAKIRSLNTKNYSQSALNLSRVWINRRQTIPDHSFTEFQSRTKRRLLCLRNILRGF